MLAMFGRIDDTVSNWADNNLIVSCLARRKTKERGCDLTHTTFFIAALVCGALQSVYAQDPQPPQILVTGSALLAPSASRPTLSNAPSATPPPKLVDAWKDFASAAELPGMHHLVTNSDGSVVHQFNMHPVVTNMAALTNDLPKLARQNAELEEEMKAALAKEAPLKVSLRDDFQAYMKIATNSAPVDDEDKQLRARAAELESQLADVHAKLQKKLETNPEFQKAKAKVESDRDGMKAIQKRKSEIVGERGDINVKVWKINQLMAQEQKAEEAKAKAKEPSAPAAAP